MSSLQVKITEAVRKVIQEDDPERDVLVKDEVMEEVKMMAAIKNWNVANVKAISEGQMAKSVDDRFLKSLELEEVIVKVTLYRRKAS